MKKMSIFALLLAAVVATSYSVSGTYAKYISTITATDSARVAAWSFEVNDKDAAKENSFTFDLFKTINDTKDGNAETDVKTGEGENIIAPGTQGEFDIVLENLSEVTAAYTLEYTVDNAGNIPVEFSVDGGQTWVTDLTTKNVTNKTVVMGNSGTDTITVQWRWVFENATDVDAGDLADTTLGSADTKAEISVTADITVVQVD